MSSREHLPEVLLFKLQRTDSQIVQLKEDGVGTLPLLQESSESKVSRTFICVVSRKFEEDANDEDEENDSDKHLSDDEDSNAEDFYKNDYPEDEEDYSDDEGKSESSIEILTESMINSQQQSTNEDTLAQLHEELGEEFEDLYDELYDDEGNGPSNFLDNGEDLDYERQHFFLGDEDDELAQHRDKIFGKLQKMIDEDN
ncbi:putative transcription factor [Wickerhamomyces ciferrii]|uniref:Transcription factor n=1 Tax=Wickerhamomyces ciferrii (strain ATCC 14091 / BCRC 22168 / CBS 111 / JCM 3599 / NBRC 0793 / NRRL Y-1031 F-60-10) TaxID=1206466 RepID=K0KNX8_WICCF|nr:putative transcription factor [Wickerhamomyces ciferrii]CCH44676.1 putative transcription factor [Wickerhamomyces ciferrii]